MLSSNLGVFFFFWGGGEVGIGLQKVVFLRTNWGNPRGCEEFACF